MPEALETDLGEWFRHHAARHQAQRAQNRFSSRRRLLDRGIPFECKNDGAHWIVRSKTRFAVIDFWPGTGSWIVRGQRERQRGLRKWIAFAIEKL